jgi:hypothetical protein
LDRPFPTRAILIDIVIAIVILSVAIGAVVGGASRVTGIIAGGRIFDDSGVLKGVVIIAVRTETIRTDTVAITIQVEAHCCRPGVRSYRARIESVRVCGIVCINNLGDTAVRKRLFRKDKGGRSRPRIAPHEEE